MSIPKSFTFFSNSINKLVWSVTDLAGAVVNSASVVTTLYWGRDRLHPELVPGTAVTNFSGTNLTYDGAAQNYSAQIFFSAPNGGDYILVVDVSSNSVVLGHYEVPSVVIRSGE